MYIRCNCCSSCSVDSSTVHLATQQQSSTAMRLLTPCLMPCASVLRFSLLRCRLAALLPLVAPLQDGQLVMFSEVVGMTELNSCKPVKVKNCKVGSVGGVARRRGVEGVLCRASVHTLRSCCEVAIHCRSTCIWLLL